MLPEVEQAGSIDEVAVSAAVDVGSADGEDIAAEVVVEGN